MLTPYDWQEGIGHRASYIEGRLVQGSPILAVSVPAGVVIFTYRRHARKVYEVYDQLAFAAIGQQSDIEALRLSAIDFAHQEGFSRSERDVTLRRVVSALSTPIKRAFADFSSPPFVIRSLFAEVCSDPAHDTYAILDYEGDFKIYREFLFVSGGNETKEPIVESLRQIYMAAGSPEETHAKLKELWDATFIVERPDGFGEEAVLLERNSSRTNRFRMLSEPRD